MTLAACLLGVSLVRPASGQAVTSSDQSTRTNSLGIKFAPVPGTTVLFAVWETRVMDYEAFVKDASYAWSYKPHFNQTGDQPVVGVNLQDAVAFCNWLTNRERAAGSITSSQGYRLPTNDEWDAAINLLRARKAEATLDEKVQDERTYPWGVQWPPPPKFGNYAENEIPGYSDGFDYTAPVGQFPPTKEGVYDLAGNVWEWVWDRQVQALPVGTLRGGSWAYFRPECLTSAYRYEVPAELRAPTIGFRCVFEDKQRTASLLAAADAQKVEAAKQRQAEFAQSKVDPSELEAMRQKLRQPAGGVETSDVSKLKPAARGSPFTNSLGMEFVPLADRSLLVGKFEARAQDYNAFVKAAGIAWDRKPTFLTEDAHPAVGVTWENAKAFCDWLTERDRAAKLIPSTARYRLPTDEEWSVVTGMPAETGADPGARDRGNKVHFPWGNDIWPPPPLSVNIEGDKVEPLYRDSYSYTAPVGSFGANQAGIHDLGGNASEWCEDAWPGAPDERVFRGGSWLSSERDALLSSARQHLPKTGSRPDLGFRCVLEL